VTDGLIFDIKRYAIHDGPGIRTTVFFKGCPLSCWWCHNPEGKEFRHELMVWPSRCINCRTCLAACPNAAIFLSSNSIITKRDKCQVCGTCTERCPASAREIVGKAVSVDDAMNEVEKDRAFYGETGGLTVSGGEPLAQPIFLHVLLDRCQDAGIHTTVDTSGYAEKEILTKISRKVDLFLYDLKIKDCTKHKLHTGVSNEPIIKNLKMLDRLGKQIIIRFPLIPQVNDTEDNITSMCELVSELRNVRGVNILSYHRLGIDKATRLGKVARDCGNLSNKRLNQSRKLIKTFGLTVNVE